MIHRDIKPGNLLVNSNCCLKICDFGLARKIDPSSRRNMTLEVVTQYYRAPELLMGATRYSSAIDTWSVGCIFAELLSRRILFQASSPVVQLDLIIDLLGTPPESELKNACGPARRHVLSQPRKVVGSTSFSRDVLASSCSRHDLTVKNHVSKTNILTLKMNVSSQMSEEKNGGDKKRVHPKN